VFLGILTSCIHGIFSATGPGMTLPHSAHTSLLINDAAVRLGVSRRTVYYRIQEGRLKTIRTRCGSQRVLCSSIDALLHESQAMRSQRAGRGRRPQCLDAEALAFQIESFS
jgi:excisionase family DNA binding protein